MLGEAGAYMTQVALQAREAHSVTEPIRDDPPAPTAASVQPPRTLLKAWLLLLLARETTHGYELGRQLADHGIAAELGTMYRTLRMLEREGCAASTWAEPVAGPRRRLYQLTTKGRRELNELVGAIAATRDVHAAFLRAHQGSGSSFTPR